MPASFEIKAIFEGRTFIFSNHFDGKIPNTRNAVHQKKKAVSFKMGMPNSGSPLIGLSSAASVIDHCQIDSPEKGIDLTQIFRNFQKTFTSIRCSRKNKKFMEDL
jgi:hypothetical protein